MAYKAWGRQIIQLGSGNVAHRFIHSSFVPIFFLRCFHTISLI